jgi:hypothetical protein
MPVGGPAPRCGGLRHRQSRALPPHLGHLSSFSTGAGAHGDKRYLHFEILRFDSLSVNGIMAKQRNLRQHSSDPI